MTQVAEISGIPLERLSEMKDEDWHKKVVTRLTGLETALQKLAPPAKAARKSGPQARERVKQGRGSSDETRTTIHQAN